MIAITRNLIVPPTVVSERDEGVAVFRVTVFNHATADSLAQAVKHTRKDMGRTLKGVVLDLRNNPGGLLDQAVDVSALFLDQGLVVETRGRHPTSEQEFESNGYDHLRGLPVVVLVNGGSASAAEVVAAALQDRGRAVVVGSSSFGKGTVQMVLSLENKGELTLTWARLFTPGGYLLHAHGVVPSLCTVAGAGDPLAAEDPGQRLPQIIEHALHPDHMPAPRRTLDDAGWSALRNTCPPDTHENALDLRLAKRLIHDPALYAQTLAAMRTNIAGITGHPSRSALQ